MSIEMHPWYVRTYLLQGGGADMSSTNADRRWAIDAPTAPQPRIEGGSPANRRRGRC
jgi:hypothetical protein